MIDPLDLAARLAQVLAAAKTLERENTGLRAELSSIKEMMAKTLTPQHTTAMNTLPDHVRNALIRAYHAARAARLAALDREQARDTKPAS